jgi:hypothetical protein
MTMKNKRSQFIYICSDCGTAYYNSIAAKCCCTEVNKNNLSHYVCPNNKKDSIKITIERDK